MKKVNIAIAENEQLTRETLTAALSSVDNINVLFDVSNGKELLDKLKTNIPDIVLLDISMPVMGGRHAIEKIKSKHKSIKVIILSVHSEDDFVLKFIQLGASAFLNKNCSIKMLVDAITSVHTTGQYLDENTARLLAKTIHDTSKILLPNEHPDNLSDTEVIILKLLCNKKSIEEINDIIGLEVSTIEFYIKNINEKTNTNTSLELERYAVQNKFLIRV